MNCLYCNNLTNAKSLEFYLEKYKNELEQIYRNKISGKDFEEISLQVHGFKPKWMMMGMKRSTELSQKIEIQYLQTRYKLKLF